MTIATVATLPSASASALTAPSSSTGWLHRMSVFGIAALLAYAALARGYDLDRMPGVNGDEAWYGVRAWSLLHGDPSATWQTPTGNPLNPLFVGPLALLHAYFPPSIALLRSVAVASGFVALVMNWFLCRWVFNPRTALVTTVLMAVLPINIAYSRFAWDASQSLAATLLVLYLALAAIRFHQRFVLWVTAAILAQAVAVWVHPTNIFIAPVIAGAMAMRWRAARNAGSKPSTSVVAALRNPGPFVLLVLAGVVTLAWLALASSGRESLLDRVHQRVASDPQNVVLPVPILFARLFTGGTVYRDIPGSRSWFEWPLPANFDGWGLDVGIFWLALLGSLGLLYRTTFRTRNSACQVADAVDEPATANDADGQTGCQFARCDQLLLVAWAISIALFVLVAGGKAMMPGQERFAVCLVAPTALVLARGAVLAWEKMAARWQPALATAGVFCAVLVLADFHTHYFRHFQRTGGEAHLTFRTGPEEPKQAALGHILQRDKEPKWIACSQWWNYWPLRYLALGEADVHVVTHQEAASSPAFGKALADGHAWFVEFVGTREMRDLMTIAAAYGTLPWEVCDYAGRPVLGVVRLAASSANQLFRAPSSDPRGHQRSAPPSSRSPQSPSTTQ